MRFEVVFKWLVFLLAAPLLWVLCAEAQSTNLVLVAEPGEVRGPNPWLTFGLDRIPLLADYEAFGIPVWQYIASLIYVFLAFYVSKLLDWMLAKILNQWAERTATRFDDLLLRLLHGPVKVVSFVILLHIGLKVFRWPVWVNEFFSKGLKIIVGISITYMVLKAVDLLTGVWKTRAAVESKSFNEQLLPIIRASLKVFIIIVASLLTLQNIGFKVTSLLASLGIGGLALSLAAQDTLANFFGGIAVFLDKPFQLGDRISLDKVDGVVESIGLRSTRVRDLNGQLITIPNKTIGNATITNVTQRPRIKTEINIGIPYDTSVERVKRAVNILEQIYGSNPMTAEFTVSFNKFTDWALNLSVIHWWNATDHKAYSAGIQQMHLAVKEKFDQEGIEFAFPSQTIYLKSAEPEQQPRTTASAGEGEALTARKKSR